tara:strand:- start:1326 stop:2603 length:1278 start_codon:yes stop_codon:yes gene_type:complete
MEDNIFRHELLNGLDTLVIEKPNTGLFYINIIVKVGSGKIYESKNDIENAHFLEHFNAKFTSTLYPKYKDINSKLEFYGIQSNAHTSYDVTSYWLYGSVDNKDFMLDILLNSYVNFKADKELLEKEREAILNELCRNKMDNNRNFIEKILNLNNFKYDIDERIENTKKITLEKLIEFRNKYYVPNNTKIILIGDINHIQIFNYLDNFFKKNKVNNKTIKLLEYKNLKIRNNIIFNKRMDLNNTLLKISFKINIDKFSLNRYVLGYIILILKQRLYRYLRYDGGKVYNVNVTDIEYTNKTTFIIISTEFRKKENAKEILEIIYNQINRINDKDISESRYVKALNFIKVFYLNNNLNNNLQLINNTYVDEFINNKELINRKDNLNNYMNINLNNIKDLGKNLFNYNNMIITHYGTHDFTEIIKSIFK